MFRLCRGPSLRKLAAALGVSERMISTTGSIPARFIGLWSLAVAAIAGDADCRKPALHGGCGFVWTGLEPETETAPKGVGAVDDGTGPSLDFSQQRARFVKRHYGRFVTVA
jgi:hypothetical protein